MKRVNIKIADQHGKVEIEAYQVDNRSLFAVHRPYLDAKPTEWILTHVPTGMRIYDYPTLKRAAAVGLKLLTVAGMPWESSTQSDFNVAPEIKAQVLSIKDEQEPREPVKPDVIPCDMMGTDSLKKGDRVTLDDGERILIWDNKKGIIRTIKRKNAFDTSWVEGSTYIADWVTGWFDGHDDPKPIYITKAQRAKLDRVVKAGIPVA